MLNPRSGCSSHLWPGGRSSLLSLVVAAAKRPDLRPLLCMGSGMAGQFLTFRPVLGIRIRRIRFVLGFPDLDSLVRGMDPDFSKKNCKHLIFKTEDNVPVGKLLEKNI